LLMSQLAARCRPLNGFFNHHLITKDIKKPRHSRRRR
jgi:hypothetical protein